VREPRSPRSAARAAARAARRAPTSGTAMRPSTSPRTGLCPRSTTGSSRSARPSTPPPTEPETLPRFVALCCCCCVLLRPSDLSRSPVRSVVEQLARHSTRRHRGDHDAEPRCLSAARRGGRGAAPCRCTRVATYPCSYFTIVNDFVSMGTQCAHYAKHTARRHTHARHRTHQPRARATQGTRAA